MYFFSIIQTIFFKDAELLKITFSSVFPVSIYTALLDVKGFPK